ncbi:excisionase family DNA-binding protein [Curtobacterium sp. MCPF17_011]|uniref:excisionase family DNA-binding protein n=1 Tax=Curtobacterium sp. MCPF17_011 TaxID=2175652 RepID=UPI0011B5A355|nr:excisionase family DNA-binding protein [Curtobacterium sp. MCPF17_011]
MDLDDVSSLETAAEYLKMTPEKLRRMAHQKKVGHIRAGRQYLFPREALETYVKENIVERLPPSVNPWGISDRSLRRLREEDRRGQQRW